jgi:hypothetical protein
MPPTVSRLLVDNGDGPVLAELVKGAFDGVAVLVSDGAEGGWPAAAGTGDGQLAHQRAEGQRVVPLPVRQIPPRAPGPGPVENPVHHQPVIIPPAPLPWMTRQQRRQPRRAYS